MIFDYSQSILRTKYDLLEDHRSPLYEKIATNFFNNHYEKCKYCETDLLTPIKNVPSKGSFGHDETGIVYDCPNCGWWFFKREESLYLGEGVSQYHSNTFIGILRKYSTDSKEVPISTLRRELLQRPKIAHELNPTRFEKLVGDILRGEVIHVGKTNDGGIDLILINSEEGSTIVQVKRRTKVNSTEGVVPIRELIGTMAINNHKQAIFVTTAKKYSKQAQEARVKVIQNKVVDKIELIDFPKFIDILKLTSHKQERPWERLVGFTE